MLKKIMKQVLPSSLYRMLRNKIGKTTEQVFTDIYKNNSWGGKNSVSGPGSEAHQSRVIIKVLPRIFEDFGISTMLDIPCGDFHWMKNVDFVDIDYTGADIVNELIKKNTEQYAKNGLRFQKLNLIRDNLPKVDLVLCRDCLVHFSFEDIFRALDNICNSQSSYLLATTFKRRTNNDDIPTGHWRPLNLELTPFTLPRPIKIINERCTAGDGNYTDKSLGLWKVADIQECLIIHFTR
ncbi:MAG: class I SAM-dependent methyltransferase [Candidatus Brocadiaceae bacterium]|nr:class I SAM-dependent methyltransferase [Candidatus Brocadiaceae bacterium]